MQQPREHAAAKNGTWWSCRAARTLVLSSVFLFLLPLLLFRVLCLFPFIVLFLILPFLGASRLP